MSSKSVRTVFGKEWVDALRDRRTLMIVLLSSVLIGPLVLVALSALVGSLEARAERRAVVVAGLAHGPSLVNYLQRQGFSASEAPSGYEARLRQSALGDPVLVIPADFEARLRQGDAPALEIVSHSANKRSEAGSARLQRLLAGFARERATVALALRGVAPSLAEPVRIHERDLADPRARGTQITGMLPFFVLMAVLYGALHAALDTTAGERERGSLEPLLASPAAPWAIVLGKWLAVFAVAMAIAVLSCFSFVPAQWLLRSDTLAALFHFGVHEALAFIAVLAPFAAAISALLMAVAIRCRSVKEAQASAGLVVLAASLAPLAGVFNLGEQAPWQLWIPALAQNTLMTRVLRGESFDVAQWLIPPAVCAVLAALALAYVAARLRQAAVN